MKARFPSILITLAIFMMLASASTSESSFREFALHELRTVPEGYSRTGPAPANQSINLRMALVNSDISGLQEAFSSISTPGNPRYRQHLSQREVSFT